MVPFIVMLSIIFALGAGSGCSSDSPDTDGPGTSQDAAPAAAGAVADAGLLPSPIDSGSMMRPDAAPSAPGVLTDSATSDAATATDATAPTDAATPDGQAVPPSTGMNCLQGSGDFSNAGPYTVKTKAVTIGSSGQFTIYVPQPLEEKCPHPMVAWGNGTTVPGGTAYRHFNERLATWGIVTIASHDDGTASSPRIGDGSFHRAAIDYLLQQNQDPSSEFFGKISGKAGVSGHSQGGAGGDRASMHPNVKANGNVQGSFGSAPRNVAFLCLTGTEDIATEGCLTAVNGTSMPAMYASFDGMTHTATLSARSAGSQQYARLLSAWFRCFLADDGNACTMFMGGADCPLCKEPGWDEIFAKNY